VHRKNRRAVINLFILAAFLFLLSGNTNAQPAGSVPTHPKFMGRGVTIQEPEHTPENFPKGPAAICVDGPPRRQCYTAPQDFGNDPRVELVQLAKDMPALLFSASSGGVSGWEVHFALLIPGSGKELDDLLLSEVSVSNLSQYAFWTEPAVSNTKILLTADAVWGPEEVHFGNRRYMISVYVQAREDPDYWLEDRYMTARKYDLGTKVNVLESERQQILARLKRVVAARKPN
jgi:hypothetical protein